MRLEMVRNDATEPTLIISEFNSRHYTIGSINSMVVYRYTGFVGTVLEVAQCNEVMDPEVVSRTVIGLVDKYSAPDVEVIVIGDKAGDNTNEGIVEVSAVQVESWESDSRASTAPTTKTIVIYKKHERDGYVEAILKLAYENEYGEGSYYGSK